MLVCSESKMSDTLEEIQVEDTLEKENIEPASKKAKIEIVKDFHPVKLESRLNGILSCAVCLDLPAKAVFQCPNGHLMCAGCFTHLLADARLKDEQASCPNCRIEINRNICSRNLAVEKAVCELPTECQFCTKELPRTCVKHHEEEECLERLVECKFKRLGCTWQGPYHERQSHQEECSYPEKSGLELMDNLDAIDQTHAKERKFFDSLVGLLSFEKITINDLQLKPYRTDDFIPQLYYESNRFSALGHQWVIKTKVFGSEKSLDRSLTYQLVQKSKATGSLHIKFLFLQSPFGDLAFKPEVHQHEFKTDAVETDFHPVTLKDSLECNKLFAARVIHVRLMMFQTPN